MRPSRIQAVDHVNLQARSGLTEDIRWFYGEVGELEEVVSVPQAPSRLCFKSARLELRVTFVDEPRINPIAPRLTLAVTSLAGASELLEERGIHYVRESGAMFTDRRLRTRDPSGHVVVLKHQWPEVTV